MKYDIKTSADPKGDGTIHISISMQPESFADEVTALIMKACTESGQPVEIVGPAIRKAVAEEIAKRAAFTAYLHEQGDTSVVCIVRCLEKAPSVEPPPAAPPAPYDMNGYRRANRERHRLELEGLYGPTWRELEARGFRWQYPGENLVVSAPASAILRAMHEMRSVYIEWGNEEGETL